MCSLFTSVMRPEALTNLLCTNCGCQSSVDASLERKLVNVLMDDLPYRHWHPPLEKWISDVFSRQCLGSQQMWNPWLVFWSLWSSPPRKTLLFFWAVKLVVCQLDAEDERMCIMISDIYFCIQIWNVDHRKTKKRSNGRLRLSSVFHWKLS